MTARLQALKHPRSTYLRWLYRDGRLPSWGKALFNTPTLWLSTSGVVPRLVTLEVPGRTSGRPIAYPLVLADHEGQDYLVSMLGPRAGWVRNVRANGLRAVLRHGRRRDAVTLIETHLDPAAGAPILKRYLECAPGARPHIPVHYRSPVADFEAQVPQYPIFQVLPGAG